MKKKKSSSAILGDLYGDIRKYQRIMKESAIYLAKKYPNKNLKTIFSTMPTKMITIAPMVLCDSTAKDIGVKCSDEILKALGMSMLWISTHDDVVDEMPRDRNYLSSLVYSADIGLMEGMRILFAENKKKVADELINSINENHFRQQIVIEELWRKRKRKLNRKQYLNGIDHIRTFVSIGPRCALAFADKLNFKEKIMKFSRGYGIGIQILDDIREYKEDRKFGYTSLPSIEGPPFRKSFEILYDNIKIAKKSLGEEWVTLSLYVNKLEDIVLKTCKDMGCNMYGKK